MMREHLDNDSKSRLSDKEDRLSTLPIELWTYLKSFLLIEDIIKMAVVSKQFCVDSEKLFEPLSAIDFLKILLRLSQKNIRQFIDCFRQKSIYKRLVDNLSINKVANLLTEEGTPRKLQKDFSDEKFSVNFVDIHSIILYTLMTDDVKTINHLVLRDGLTQFLQHPENLHPSLKDKLGLFHDSLMITYLSLRHMSLPFIIGEGRIWNQGIDILKFRVLKKHNKRTPSQLFILSGLLAECMGAGPSKVFINLAGANLRGINCSNNLRCYTYSFIKLHDLNLEGAELCHADLSGLTLERVNLQRADLSGANVSNTCFFEVNLAGALIGGMKIKKTSFRGVKFFKDFNAQTPEELDVTLDALAAQIKRYQPTKRIKFSFAIACDIAKQAKKEVIDSRRYQHILELLKATCRHTLFTQPKDKYLHKLPFFQAKHSDNNDSQEELMKAIQVLNLRMNQNGENRPRMQRT